jgi:hypothetical protein
MEIRESKTINLLYTHIDSFGNFLPNGNELGFENTTFHDGSGFFSTHVCHNDLGLPKELKITKTHIDNFDPNTTYFYVVAHPALSLNECLDFNIPVNNKILELLKKYNNIFIVFLYEHEPDNNDAFPKLIEYISSRNLDSSKFVIVNNNSYIYREKEHYKTQLKVHKSGFLTYSSHRVLENVNAEFIPNKTGKFFISRNRNPKPHRTAFLLHLYLNNLINDINYSFVPEKDSRINNPYGYVKFFNVSTLKENKELVEYINTHTKLDDYEKNLEWIDKNTNEFTHQKDLPSIFLVPELNTSFENSYFNIVTESVYDGESNVVHHTEKTFRPFYYYQFPIFLATPGHIDKLKEEYNFDFFDDILDNSYDFESNSKIRMEMVIKLIKEINENKEKYINFYINNKERFENNRKIYKQAAMYSKKRDFDFFWNLL